MRRAAASNPPDGAVPPTRLDDALRGLPTKQAQAVKSKVRGRRVSYGAKYTPQRGLLRGVEFRNRGEYALYRDMVSEARGIVERYPTPPWGSGPGLIERPRRERRRLYTLGRRLMDKVGRTGSRDDWAFLLTYWY